jgi:hypothetical protein
VEPRDRELLVGFVDQARTDLPEKIFPMAEPYLQDQVAELLWPAWAALESRNEFGDLRVAIESREYDRRLDNVGLSGPELAVKLAGVEAARTTCLESRKPSRPLLRRWLKWLDVTLGSLLSAVGVGEGIKEIKEGIEAELESRARGRRGRGR